MRFISVQFATNHESLVHYGMTARHILGDHKTHFEIKDDHASIILEVPHPFTRAAVIPDFNRNGLECLNEICCFEVPSYASIQCTEGNIDTGYLSTLLGKSRP